MYDGLSRYYDGWGFDQGLLFFIASGVMLLSSIPMFFVPEGGIHYRTESSGGSGGLGEVPASTTAPVARKFLVFLLAMVFFNFGLNSVVLLKPQYLSLGEGFSVSSRTLSYILNMGSVAAFAAGLTMKKLSQRFSDEFLLVCSTLLAVTHLLMYVLAENLTAIYLSEAVGGVARVLGMAAGYAYASRLIPPGKRGRQFAWFNATLFLSWGLPGTLITGPIVDHLINTGAGQVFAYRMSFLTAAAMVLLATLVLVYVVRMNRSKRREAGSGN
jgi:predicted MFS family arabinose efflux permease